MRPSLPSRLLLVLCVSMLAGCQGAPAPQEAPPLSFDYLPPIGLNVATVEVEQRFFPGGPEDASALSPVDPVATLRALATARLKPFGATGQAVVAITDASLTRAHGVTAGTFALEVDLFAAGATTRSGFAEARVTRRTDSDEDARAVLTTLVRQLADAMNVELEYQVRSTLKDWLVTGPGSQPGAVEAVPLPPPGVATGAETAPAAPALAPAPGYAPPPAIPAVPPASNPYGGNPYAYPPTPPYGAPPSTSPYPPSQGY